MSKTITALTLLLLLVLTESRFNKQKTRKREKNCYETLEISEKATPTEIKKKFRKLAKIHHPDKAKGEEEKKQKEEIFKELARCYQILSDEDSRKKYDAAGYDENYEQYQTPFDENTFSKGGFKFSGSNINLEDLFGGAFSFGETGGQSGFGGQRQQREQRQQRAPRKETVNIYLELKDILKDTNQEIRVKQSSKPVKIKIPKGVPNEHIIKGKKGLDIKVNILDDYEFQRGDSVMKRAHLYKDVSVTLKDWLIGFDLKVKCLDGEIIDVHIDGMLKEYVIKGKGLPRFKGKTKGDLYLKFNVLYPNKLTKKQKNNVKELIENDKWSFDKALKEDKKKKKKIKEKLKRQRKKNRKQ